MYQQQANMAEALFNDLSLEDKAGQGAQEKTHGHVQKQELPARISPTGVVSADAGAEPAAPESAADSAGGSMGGEIGLGDRGGFSGILEQSKITLSLMQVTSQWKLNFDFQWPADFTKFTCLPYT